MDSKRLSELRYKGHITDNEYEELKLAIKALEWQHKMQYGNCDYCKHKNYNSIEYPCNVCGNREPFYKEMWEEAENE